MVIVKKPFRTIDLAPSPHMDLFLSLCCRPRLLLQHLFHRFSFAVCVSRCMCYCLASLGNTWSRSMSRVLVGGTSPPVGLKGELERTMMAAPEDVSETETPALNCEKESDAFKEHQTLHQRASPCCLHAASASVHFRTEA